LGGLVGVIVASVLASRWYDFLANKLLFIFAGHLNIARVVCFLLLFIIIWRLVGLLFNLINKIFNLFSFIPFLKTINRLAGGVFGFLEGALVLGLVLFFLTQFPITWLTSLINNSTIAQFLIKIAKILWPLLPLGLKKMQDIQ